MKRFWCCVCIYFIILVVIDRIVVADVPKDYIFHWNRCVRTISEEALGPVETAWTELLDSYKNRPPTLVVDTSRLQTLDHIIEIMERRLSSLRELRRIERSLEVHK